MNISIDLQYNHKYKWTKYENIYVKGYAYSNEVYLVGEKFCQYFQSINDIESFEKALLSLNGLYSIVIQKDKEVFAAVDRLRTFPLLYQQTETDFYITDNILFFKKNKFSINEKEIEKMRYIGYVTGRNTLLKNVFQLQAGEMLHFQNNKVTASFFYRIKNQILKKNNRQEYKDALRQQILHLGEKLYLQTIDRPVAILLSGGYDSRLIALLLSIHNKKDILCFTYGTNKTNEVEHAQKVAKKLNFPWEMIDYTPYKQEKILNNKTFKDYVDFTSNGISFPYIQEYFASRYVKEELQLSENTIILPGHAGDYVAGGHFFPDMKIFDSEKDLAFKIFRTHYRIKPTNKQTKNYLLNEIAKDIENLNYYNHTHLAFDDWEVRERQSKQIVNCTKIWDYFGYEYRLPLWDNELADFFMSLPFEMRIDKNLYDEVVEEMFKNYGILFKKELNPTHQERREYYLKQKLKQYFPILSKIRKYRDDYASDYLGTFVQQMSEALNNSSNKTQSNVSIHTDWFLKYFREEL